mmetsp:Transcript_8739/g.25177  ORF Transcript_8739/g.25177 Transcript_8739/m.25177 type:complete len:157 (+) Transcript_8739:209-679(+)|eukprot:CAMPEP_0117652808 /NCGR_PEP_ID=MMETSP0804-20121206/2835_1 /TAXON_ID=1074897 /ORGANISM="Tetraselmis astigmatica, Strain CCMP880" /LENGTH=156 /DNA_ID=CAMNT_0005458901 /DNA_START=165 /DNA_END=635 /DNA_ORIENTATION=+
MGDKLAPSDRHQFVHNGQVVYEWDQTLSEVNVYCQVPQGVTAKLIYCTISKTHLKLGINPNPPYLDLDFAGQVRVDDCTWTLDGCSLHIFLEKLKKGEAWKSAFAGHEVDVMTAEADQKRLMLERFQEENPGFDFSGADFNGNVPDPRTFMGGIKQ